MFRHSGHHVEASLAIDDDACVRDLTIGLDDEENLGVRLDGRWFGPDAALADIGFYEGAVVDVLPREAPAPAAAPASNIALAVVTGSDAGRSYPFGAHPLTIGRDPTCDVVLDDPSVSRVHASVDRDGRISDAGSTNGTWLDGEPVVDARPLTTGAEIRVGATLLRVDALERFDRPTALTAGPSTPFNRPPRAGTPATPDPLVAPEPSPPSPASRAFGIAMIAGPVLMGAGMVVIYGNPRFALFAALAPVVALLTYMSGRRSARRERKRHTRAFRVELEAFADDLACRAAIERAALEEAHPDPAEIVRRAVLPSVSLWERRPGDHDFLHLRVGTGPRPWAPVAAPGRAGHAPEVQAVVDAHRLLDRAAVTIDLSDGGVVGVVGPSEARSAVARWLVAQTAVLHGPADLRLSVFGGAEWDWVKWLPHVDRDPSRDDTGDQQRLVVVPDHALAHGRNAPVRALLQSHAGIVLAPTEDQLPALCDTIVTLHSDLGDAEVRRPRDRLCIRDVLTAGVSEATARTCARAIARFDDPELGSVGARLPDATNLLPLLGIDLPTAAAITDRWRGGGDDPSPRTVIGVGDDGPVIVDLVADGPHGLIGGTTGSGKSELLRTLVAGMASAVDPDHLVFVLVDYKGGSAFDECARLPHVVGMVTDLDDQLAERALRSLEAELRHRERLLRDHGAADLPAYLRAGAVGGQLPRLVVVIDEFATMAAELPDFLGALVGIAQRGRSLGVHLLLATQRPSGAVNANIKANTNLRIALRVQDGNDSNDIIDSPCAASVARSTPGRAYVRRGPGDVVLVQTALSTSSIAVGRRAPVRVRPFTLTPDAIGWPEERTGPTELEALVAAIRDAGRTYAPPRRPWLPMLPERLATGDLPMSPPSIVAFALADDPDHQRQIATGWDPAEGHLALYGMVGSGTTTAVLSVVEALARTHEPAECHVYAVDFGTGLAPLRDIPHVGAVIGASEREAQARLVRLLRTELERRRAAGSATPHVVVCIDGIAAFLAEHDTLDGSEVSESFRRVFAEGPAVGITFVVTADRAGAMPLRLASHVRQKLLFRLADPSDYGMLGLRPAQLPRFVPGRAVQSDGNRVVQIALPGDLAAITGSRVAAAIGVLPTAVDVAALPGAGAAPVRAPWALPVGVRDADLGTAWLPLHSGDHVLVAGPPRSGKTTALAALATVARADPDAVLVAVCGRRSPLHDVAAFDATGTLDELVHVLRAAPGDPRRWLVFVDESTAVDDADGVVAALLRADATAVHVVAAARCDDLRAAYGHWVRVVRQSRTGLLLQPDLAADGDLLGVRLPRRVAVPLLPGRGFVVVNGDADLVQAVNIEIT